MIARVALSIRYQGPYQSPAGPGPTWQLTGIEGKTIFLTRAARHPANSQLHF